MAIKREIVFGKAGVYVKKIRKILVAAMCVFVILPVFVVNASAAGVTEWDGKSELEAGKTYIVTDEVKIKKDFTIPDGTKVSVKNGGFMKIYSTGSLKVHGELAVAIGGTIFNSGELNVKKDGVFNVYGLFQSSVSADVSLSGATNVYNQGIMEISSTVKMFKGSELYTKGDVYFYKSSNAKLSGSIVGEKNSQLHLQGVMNISVSGTIEAGGHLTVGSHSNVRCSGTINLEKTASFTRFRVITVTQSGSFNDNRPEDEYSDMTVDILVDEPRVKSKGIDVSYAQGEINWKKVADSGVEFAIIRAGRGRAGSANEMKEDDYFRQNIEQAQKYGIDVGVYFYSYATTVAEAQEEARFYVDIIKGYEIQYPVILDMEEEFQNKISTKKLTKMIEAFFEVLKKEGYYPMLYSYKAWLEYNLDMTILDKYAVWLAQVGDEVTYEGGYYIWQYSFKGKVKGIDTDVDLDISYRDFPEILKKYGLNNL